MIVDFPKVYLVSFFLTIGLLVATVAEIGSYLQALFIDTFLISPLKHTLWVLIRSTSPKCF